MQFPKYISQKKFFSVAVVVLSAFGPTHQVQSETLKEVLILAYQNSELLKRSEVTLSIQDENIAQTEAASRPSLSLTLGANYQSNNRDNDRDNSQTGRVELLTEYNLVDFGANEISVGIEEIIRQSAEINHTQTEQLVLMDAVEGYQEVLRAKNLLDLEKNNLKGLESQLEAANNRFELGNISRTELSLVRARVASAKGNVRTREGQVEIANERFYLAVGKYPENLSGSHFNYEIPKDIESAMELANQHNPALLMAKLEVIIAQQQRELVKVQATKPPINLRGSASSDLNLRQFNETPLNNLTISVQTSIPLYSGGRLSSALRQAEQNLQGVRINLKQEAKLQENEIINSWHRYEIAESLIDVYLQQQDHSQLALQGTKVEESLGTKSTLDVLEAEQDLLSAQTQLVEAVIERDLAKFTLLSKIGVLTMNYLGLDPSTESEVSAVSAEDS